EIFPNDDDRCAPIRRRRAVINKIPKPDPTKTKPNRDRRNHDHCRPEPPALLRAPTRRHRLRLRIHIRSPERHTLRNHLADQRLSASSRPPRNRGRLISLRPAGRRCPPLHEPNPQPAPVPPPAPAPAPRSAASTTRHQRPRARIPYPTTHAAKDAPMRLLTVF